MTFRFFFIQNIIFLCGPKKKYYQFHFDNISARDNTSTYVHLGMTVVKKRVKIYTSTQKRFNYVRPIVYIIKVIVKDM